MKKQSVHTLNRIYENSCDLEMPNLKMSYQSSQRNTHLISHPIIRLILPRIAILTKVKAFSHLYGLENTDM